MAEDDSGREAGAPSSRLREAIKQVAIVRDGIPRRRRPDQDSALARAEYWLRGVADELEEDDDDRPDEIDPSLVTDGGEGPEEVHAHLDFEGDIDPASVFKAKAECSHPPDAVEPFGDAPDGPDGYCCTECGHVLDGWELEDRGITA